MEKSFNFSDLLRMQKCENKHKIKPTQFLSVAGGVRKRFESNIKEKRRTRLSNFDSLRNLPKCETPVKPQLNKAEQRMIQLQKWKEEKEKKKKQVMSQKKKPFLVGTVKASLKFEPPPPVSWPLPSTSGRVTRSQASRDKASNKKQEKAKLYSFAPKNATFNPKLDDLPMPSVSRFEQPNERITQDLPKCESRRLRSRTKLPDAGVKKTQNQSRPESAFGLQNKTVNKNTKKSVPNTKNKILKQISTSSSNDSNEEEMTSQENKITTRKTELTGTTNKPNKLLTLEHTKNAGSSSTSTDEKVENPQKNPDNSKKPVSKVQKAPNTPKMHPDTEKLIDLSNSFVNMEVDVEESNALKVPKSGRRRSSTRKQVKTNETPIKMIETATKMNETPIKMTETPIKMNETPIKTNETPIKMNETSTKMNETPIEMNETPIKTNEVQDLITFTPMHPIPKSESSSEEKLRSPKSDVPMTPQEVQEEAKKISPRVYLSRGKENTRKELKKKIDEGLLDEDICDMSVDHFRKQLDSELIRISEMCDTWDKISEQTVLPDEIQEALLSAVGQGRLLMSQKLQQFASLLRRCEQPEPGQALVTTVDLQGFWDMVFMQVEDVDLRFKKLEQARARGWTVEQPAVAVARQKRRPQPVNRAARATRPAPNNRLKDIIAAARRAKQADTDNTKTFEAGFFRVQSPVKSPAAAGASTPLSKPSLLKSVLSSEAKKASSKKSSYAMLRASGIAKNVDSDESPYEENLAPINLGATPGKSILKCNNNTSVTKSSNKTSFRFLLDHETSGEEKSHKYGEHSETAENSENIHDSQKLQNKEKSQNQSSDNQQISLSLQNGDSVTANTETEGKEKKRKSRRKLAHDTEKTQNRDNTQGPEELLDTESSLLTPYSKNLQMENVDSVTMDTVGEEKENRRRSRRRLTQDTEKTQNKDETQGPEELLDTESSLLTPYSKNLQMENVDSVTMDTVGEEKENRRRSRRRLTQDTEKIQNKDETQGPEELLNTESSILTPYSKNQQMENVDSVTMDTEGEGKENRRRSRRRLTLQRQDAVEGLESTPMMTRSRRKTVKTPASEKVNETRASRTKK